MGRLQEFIEKEEASLNVEFDDYVRKLRLDFDREVEQAEIELDFHIESLWSRYDLQDLIEKEEAIVKVEFNNYVRRLQLEFDFEVDRAEIELDFHIRSLKCRHDRPRKSGRRRRMRCFNCGKNGHLQSNCFRRGWTGSTSDSDYNWRSCPQLDYMEHIDRSEICYAATCCSEEELSIVATDHCATEMECCDDFSDENMYDHVSESSNIYENNVNYIHDNAWSEFDNVLDDNDNDNVYDHDDLEYYDLRHEDVEYDDNDINYAPNVVFNDFVPIMDEDYFNDDYENNANRVDYVKMGEDDIMYFKSLNDFLDKRAYYGGT